MLNKDSFSDVQTQLRVTAPIMPPSNLKNVKICKKVIMYFYKTENVTKVMSGFDSAET